MGKIGTFFKEVRYEMQAVKWPNSETLRKNAIIVFTAIAIFTVFFMGIDFLTSSLLNLLP